MLFYRAALPLSSQTLTYTAAVIRRHRKKIGSPWRRLSPAQQALLVLAYLRKRRDIRRARGRVRRRHRHGLAVCHRDRGLAGRPLPEAAPGAGGREGGRACLRGDRRHVDPHRPRCRRPAVLFRQTPPPRHEPAGDLRPRRGDRVGVRAAARRGARPDRGPDPGLVRELAASGLIVLADKGYAGAGEHVQIPYTGAGASPPPRRRPTAPTPACAHQASAPTPSSEPGASCADSAAALGVPGSWPRPSTSFRLAESEDERSALTGNGGGSP